MPTLKMLVYLDLPPGADHEDVRDYVYTAVRSSKGQLTGSPNPMAYLDPGSVYVSEPKLGRKPKEHQR